ncbi:MAG: hypothetical protein IIA27_02300 [Gemmatimonadetes bacterium]|nr:hypothetical protein [Gemmatimonadota bacterium]
MSRRIWVTAGVLFLVGAAVTDQAMAQMGRRRGGSRHVQARVGCVENALRSGETLALTEEQTAQLEALRTSCIERQQLHLSEAMELRSRLQARQIAPEEFREARQSRQETARAGRDQTRTSLEGILTEEQMSRLSRMQQRAARTAGRGFRGQGRSRQGFQNRGRHDFRRQSHRGFRGRGQARLRGR